MWRNLRKHALKWKRSKLIFFNFFFLDYYSLLQINKKSVSQSFNSFTQNFAKILWSIEFDKNRKIWDLKKNTLVKLAKFSPICTLFAQSTCFIFSNQHSNDWISINTSTYLCNTCLEALGKHSDIYDYTKVLKLMRNEFLSKSKNQLHILTF